MNFFCMMMQNWKAFRMSAFGWFSSRASARNLKLIPFWRAWRFSNTINYILLICQLLIAFLSFCRKFWRFWDYFNMARIYTSRRKSMQNPSNKEKKPILKRKEGDEMLMGVDTQVSLLLQTDAKMKDLFWQCCVPQCKSRCILKKLRLHSHMR